MTSDTKTVGCVAVSCAQVHARVLSTGGRTRFRQVMLRGKRVCTYGTSENLLWRETSGIRIPASPNHPSRLTKPLTIPPAVLLSGWARRLAWWSHDNLGARCAGAHAFAMRKPRTCTLTTGRLWPPRTVPLHGLYSAGALTRRRRHPLSLLLIKSVSSRAYWSLLHFRMGLRDHRHTYMHYIDYIHTCIHAYMHTCMLACLHVCFSVYWLLYLYACTHTWSKASNVFNNGPGHDASTAVPADWGPPACGCQAATTKIRAAKGASSSKGCRTAWGSYSRLQKVGVWM